MVGVSCGRSSSDESWTRGVGYAVQGKFNEAEKEFEKALEADPLYARAKVSLKIIEAVRDQKVSSKAAIHLFKGKVQANKKAWNEAIAEYNKAIELNPKFAYAYNDRGLAHFDKGQYDQALSDFTKAIQLNPRFAGAYINRGMAYDRKGQYDQAISDYDKVIEMTPKFAGAYNNRAVAHYLKRKYGKAWEDVYKAQSLGCQVHPGFLKALREASGRER